MLGPAPDVAQSNLCHFGVRVGEVRRHLRGSVLPSVDLAQDVSQHEVPRSGCYATQHGLLDGADDALREVGVAPGHLLLDVPEIHQLLELPLEVALARRSFSGSAATFLVSASMATSMKGYPKAFMSARSTCSWFMGPRGTKLL